MTFVHAIQSGVKRWLDFSGRSSRAEWGYFVGLLPFLVGVVLGLLTKVLNIYGYMFGTLADVVVIGIGLPFMIASIAMAVRRFHDINKSGWWALLFLLPIVSLLTWLYLLFKKGDMLENRFGANPHYAGNEIVPAKLPICKAMILCALVALGLYGAALILDKEKTPIQKAVAFFIAPLPKADPVKAMYAPDADLDATQDQGK